MRSNKMIEEKLNSDRHFYLYAKYHYARSGDVVKDLSILYNKLYGFKKTDSVPIVYIIDKLQSLAFQHIKQNDRMFQDFLSDILPENTWHVGYDNKENFRMFEADKVQEPYDVKLAIIYKLLSILRLRSVSEIPFELGTADSKIMPLSKNLKKNLKNHPNLYQMLRYVKQ